MPSDLPPVWTADETDQLAAQVDDLAGRVAALETGGVPPIPPSTEGVDLVVVTFAPPVLIQGSSVNLSATVQNRGASPVPAGTIVGVGFALDAGLTLAEGESVTWASTDAGLAAGATVVLDSNTAQYHGGTWAPPVSGEHVLSAFVDDLNRVPEYDEANNRVDVDVLIAERVTGGGGGGSSGARLFAENSPWNTDKGAGLVFAEGADWLLSSASYGVNNGAYSHPMTYSTPDDPVHQFAMPNTWGWPSCTISARMSDNATPASGTDGHLFLVADDGRTFDMWILRSTGHRAWRCESWAQHTVDGSGWGSTSPQFLAAGITAAGAPTGAGTITEADCQAGRIEHALCMAWAWGDQGGNGTCWTGQLPPAVASDVNGGPGPLAEGALCVATGNPPAGLNAMETALFDACKKYGVWTIDKLDGAPQFYGDRSDAVGNAFRGDKVTAIGRQLRMVVTW